MDWDFTENIAFKSLIEAFKECDETSATEFLASDGASYYLELIQDAAGDGIDISAVSYTHLTLPTILLV